MSDIVWEEPPARKRSTGDGKHKAFFDALRENPGKWAKWPAGKTNVNTIKDGRYVGIEAGEFDAVSRGGTVYVRKVVTEAVSPPKGAKSPAPEKGVTTAKAATPKKSTTRKAPPQRKPATT